MCLRSVVQNPLMYSTKEATKRLGVETVYKFIPENMSIAVGILSVGSMEPAIYVGVICFPF